MKFEDKIKVLWDEPSKHSTKSPLTDEMVKEAEEKLSVKLPADYKEISYLVPVKVFIVSILHNT